VPDLRWGTTGSRESSTGWHHHARWSQPIVSGECCAYAVQASRLAGITSSGWACCAAARSISAVRPRFMRCRTGPGRRLGRCGRTAPAQVPRCPLWATRSRLRVPLRQCGQLGYWRPTTKQARLGDGEMAQYAVECAVDIASCPYARLRLARSCRWRLFAAPPSTRRQPGVNESALSPSDHGTLGRGSPSVIDSIPCGSTATRSCRSCPLGRIDHWP
jgi:hypothetical protein